jgi:hypothetical protein
MCEEMRIVEASCSTPCADAGISCVCYLLVAAIALMIITYTYFAKLRKVMQGFAKNSRIR